MEPPVGIKDIKDFAYITSRKLKNARDEQTGVFNKRPYRLRCNNCGKSILIGKISSK